MAQPGAAVNVPQPAVVSSNPADWTPHVLDAQVEALAVAPDGLHVSAGGSFTKINGVAQKSLVKLRLRDGARITAFKGKTNARVKDMAVSGGRLYGLPLSWNPGRDRGVGAFALVAAAQGLWIGSDTDRIGRHEYHGRIAFMPLAGGTTVPGVPGRHPARRPVPPRHRRRHDPDAPSPARRWTRRPRSPPASTGRRSAAPS
jgi:hypothetical protein